MHGHRGPGAWNRWLCASSPRLVRIVLRSSVCHLEVRLAASYCHLICIRSPLGYDNSEFAEELRGLAQRQAHDAAVAALEPRDEGAGASLDAVGARLVEGLARFDVGTDAGVVQRLE